MLRSQHTAKAVLAVGLRQKALLQRFLIATTASRVFPQPARSAIIRAIRGKKLAPIRAN
jgi:hypothetical protein